MKQKAKQCDQCKFFAIFDWEHVCRAGNFPRFYTPTFLGSGGWKRVCEDFKPKAGK